ncbi:hypothetical protein [Candidatus Soleaferrea massiliensis]|uniref:hypothetical protein n=1 Tax=Candidatus Soleaferrea massiliensis TaxID=1470354 RepID=UPI0005911A36|nr:hypothetical protein [Candidatus Soleaferrea massiliensis]
MDEFEKHKEEERIRRGYTESYLSAMTRRLNLQMIGSFIRDGSDKVSISYDSFNQREADAYSKLENRLTEKYGKKEADEIITHVNEYSFVVEEIYFSLGMKTGATLHCKLTDNFETDI